MEDFYKYLNDKINTNSTNDANSIHFWNDEWNVMDKSAKTYSYDCCKNCPNNPANNPPINLIILFLLHFLV